MRPEPYPPLSATKKSTSLSVGDNVNVIVPQGENSQAFIIPKSLDNLYYVKKSGDTMTGSINIKEENINSESTSAVDIYGDGLYINDVNNKPMGKVRVISLSSGYDGIEFSATKNINGTEYNNSIRLLIDKSGNNLVEISDPTAWKTALGIS